MRRHIMGVILVISAFVFITVSMGANWSELIPLLKCVVFVVVAGLGVYLFICKK